MVICEYCDQTHPSRDLWYPSTYSIPHCTYRETSRQLLDSNLNKNLLSRPRIHILLPLLSPSPEEWLVPTPLPLPVFSFFPLTHRPSISAWRQGFRTPSETVNFHWPPVWMPLNWLKFTWWQHLLIVIAYLSIYFYWVTIQEKFTSLSYCLDTLKLTAPVKF